MIAPGDEGNQKKHAHLLNRARKLLTATLICAFLVSILGSGASHAVPTIVLAVLVAITILFGYIFAEDGPRQFASLFPAALALEAIVVLHWRRDTTAQVIVTGVVAAALLLSVSPTPHRMGWQMYLRSILFIQNKQHTYGWIGLRAAVIVLSNTDGDTRVWYVAQLLLILAILMYASVVFGKATEDHNAQLIASAAAGTVTVMYTGVDVVPWGMSTVVLAIPLVAVLNTAIPGAPQKDAIAERKTPALLSVVIPLAAAIVCIGTSLVWEHNDAGHQQYSDTYRMPVVQYSAACPQHLNKQVCGSRPRPLSVVNDEHGCCCYAGETPQGYYIPLDDRSACVPKQCATRLTSAVDVSRDCCAHVVDASTRPLMAGPYQCVCGNTPSEPFLHEVSGGKCICAQGYSGVHCGIID